MMLSRIWGIVLLCLLPLGSMAQSTVSADSLSSGSPQGFDQSLQTIVIQGHSHRRQSARTGSTIEWIDSAYLAKHFTGSFTQTLSMLPGVNVISIGSGYGKPVIRGLGFNRIAYVTQGLKQEGQQWGADHGLEVDAYDQDPVEVVKGAASLLYGSDALGGVIVRREATPPAGRGLYGSLSLSGQSITMGGGGSLLLGYRNQGHHLRIRTSAQYHGDRNVTTDSINYLTRNIPIFDRRLKNSATYNYAGQALYQWRGDGISTTLHAAVNGERSGFFPGAHGIPDLGRVQPDGNRYDIALPYSTVRQISTSAMLRWQVAPRWALQGHLGWQQNLRREMSAFHTHYTGQQPPVDNPDREFEFDLHTISMRVSADYYDTMGGKWSLTTDGQYQKHQRAGYGFLLPDYRRTNGGISLVYQGKIASRLHLTGGLRYDVGSAQLSAYEDPYLAHYLEQMGASSEELDQYRYSSQAAHRVWHNLSGSIGLAWQASETLLTKVNLGKSFRLPGIYELGANGIHHGSFRHEVGDVQMKSEEGWLLDASMNYDQGIWSWTISPFVTYFTNYIFLQPSGKWSRLPHSGQIYHYLSTPALFTGIEAETCIDFHPHWSYHLQGDYLYTYNLTDQLALPFSPPARFSHDINWHSDRWTIGMTHRMVAPQRHIARNEAPTPGTATLIDLRADLKTHWGKTSYAVSLALHNLLDTQYFDHMSYYRRVGLPEAGRNIQLHFNISF